MLRPVLYHDECQGGNILTPVKTINATIFYVSFLELAEAFHLEQCWLPEAFLSNEECERVDGRLSTAIGHCGTCGNHAQVAFLCKS